MVGSRAAPGSRAMSAAASSMNASTGNGGTCYGDSGGPGYVEAGGALYAFGVTSRAYSNGTGNCGEGGIYTLASAYAGVLVTGAAFLAASLLSWICLGIYWAATREPLRQGPRVSPEAV